MSLRRLAPADLQPDSFEFSKVNMKWAKAQLKKYPKGRQASAVIPLLWRAQEQESWLSRPAIEYVADMLDMPYIRALEVATFYFMFQLQPVGKMAHIQVCGTTPCMLCGSEALIDICKDRIGAAHAVSSDGKFSWEEVECLGACSNAPMVQIGKDYYEDLTPETFTEVLNSYAAGQQPRPGPQNGRFAAEPLGGATSLADFTPEQGKMNTANASVDLAIAEGANDTGDASGHAGNACVPEGASSAEFTAAALAAYEGDDPQSPKMRGGWGEVDNRPKKKATKAKTAKKAAPKKVEPEPEVEAKDEWAPTLYTATPDNGADDLKQIKGVGPKLEGVLNGLGIYRFDQIVDWTADNIAWVDSHLQFKGRIERDDWVAQAKILATGGETEFSKRVEKGQVPSSKS